MSIIDQLKNREASDRSQARTNYRKLVEAVARGEQPTAAKAAEILSNAGQTADAFAQHVELARAVNAQRERVASMRGNGPGLRAQLTEAVEARQQFEAEKARVFADLERREKETHERVSHLRRTIDRESKAVSELARLESDLAKQLGESVSEPGPVPEAKAAYSQTPGRDDLQDKQPVLGRDGQVRWEPLPGA